MRLRREEVDREMRESEGYMGMRAGSGWSWVRRRNGVSVGRYEWKTGESGGMWERGRWNWKGYRRRREVKTEREVGCADERGKHGHELTGRESTSDGARR